MRAGRTLHEGRPGPPAFCMPTVGTTKTLRPSQIVEVIQAGLFGGETCLEIPKSSGIIVHTHEHYIWWLPESSKHPLLAHFSCTSFYRLTLWSTSNVEASRLSLLAWPCRDFPFGVADILIEYSDESFLLPLARRRYQAGSHPVDGNRYFGVAFGVFQSNIMSFLPYAALHSSQDYP